MKRWYGYYYVNFTFKLLLVIVSTWRTDSANSDTSHGNNLSRRVLVSCELWEAGWTRLGWLLDNGVIMWSSEFQRRRRIVEAKQRDEEVEEESWNSRLQKELSDFNKNLGSIKHNELILIDVQEASKLQPTLYSFIILNSWAFKVFLRPLLAHTSSTGCFKCSNPFHKLLANL